MKRKFLSILLTLAMALTLLPTAAMAEGASYDCEGGTDCHHKVAKINDDPRYDDVVAHFDTLEEAIRLGQMETPPTFKLLDDLTEDVVVPAGKNIYLDLNGHKLTNASGHTITVEKGGKLNISDSVGTGVVDNTSHGKGAIVNSGEVTLNGGTFKRSAEKGTYSPYGNGGNSWYTIANYGTMEINTGVTVENAGGYSSMIRNGGDATADCDLTIRGGNFAGGINTVKNDSFGVLTINGGNFSNTAQYVIMNWNKAEITAGTFQTLDTASAVLFTSSYGADANTIGKLSISGGEFKHASDTQEMIVDRYDASNSGTAAVTGGRFDADISKYIPSDYVQSADGTVEKLGETNAVAQIGDTYYKTLAAAVAAAQDGQTVKLLTNTTVSASMLISKDITIDLNGKQIKTECKQAFKIVAKDQYAGGSLKVTGEGTIDANNKNGTFFLVGTETSESPKKSTLMIDKNVKLINGAYAVWVQHADPVKASYNVEVDIYGSLSGIEPIYVSGNVEGTQGNVPVIWLHDGANIEVTRYDLEVYIGGYAKVIIDKATSTNTVKDGNALTISAGELEINGATIIGGDTVGKNVAGGGGAVDVTASSAVFVKQHTTNLPLKITINDGTFKAAVPFNQAAGQATTPAPDKITLSIKGGYFVSTGSAADGSVAVKSDDKTAFITGGYFTSDPTAYKADGKYVISSDKDGYSYMISDTAPTKAEVIVNDKTAVTVPTNENLTNEDKTAIQTKTNIDGVAEAVAGSKDAIVKKAGVDASTVDATKLIEVEVAVDVAVSDVQKNAEAAVSSISFTAKPTATVKVNGTAKDTKVPVTNDMLNGKAITVKLPLPTGFNPEQIKHISSDGSVEYFLKTAKRGANTFEIKDGCAVFTIYGFSTFELSGTVTYVEPSSGGGSSSSSRRYDVSAPSVKHGDVTVSPKTASKGDTVTITVKPDSGYELDTLTVKDASGSKIKVKDKGDGKFTFTMPASKVTVSAEFAEIETLDFADVSTDAYYYEAVKWAAKKGITGGTGDGTFNPNGSCTRAHIVTFLWRAAGSPEPKSTVSFADVPAGSYYAKAVAWAVENGITLGTGDGTFSPNATCTRAQSVTFLYRAMGTAPTTVNGFTDVAADAFYADAVAWAVESGVTNGTSASTFSPNNGCTRTQIVTFLYRTMK